MTATHATPATGPDRGLASISACSFCQKTSDEVRQLVAGPGVFICDECAHLVLEIMAGGPEPQSVPSVAPWERITDADAVLTNLPRIARAGAMVDDYLVQWVRHGRSLGATWAKIGEALGMTRQSAWERFSGEE